MVRKVKATPDPGASFASRKKARVRAPASEPVPQTMADAAAAIAKIGGHQRARETIETGMNADLAAKKLFWEAQARPHAEAIKALSKGVQTWCEANRVTLTHNGARKNFRFSSGNVRWRLTPPKVSLRNVDAILKALKAKALGRFLRVKEEVDKEAILREPDAVKGIRGISIGQTEEFVIEPFETKLEEVA